MITYPVSRPFIGSVERAHVAECVSSSFLTQGPLVAQFEREFAEFLAPPVAELGFGVVACSSGTAAVHLALLALGVKPGDEVLVPNLTFVATANAVAYIGAVPVLVDVEADSWNIDLADAERKITSRTTAIVPVHLYGRPCDMDAVMRLAARHRLWVVEDAAQGLGGRAEGGRPLGTIGHAGTFSFYANKIITTVEGGAVVSRHPDVLERVRLLRGQGQGARRYFHEVVGFNYRMSDLHASVGIAQLAQIRSFLAERREIFTQYRCYLNRIAPQPAAVEGEAPWLFTLRLPEGVSPTQVASELLVREIETRPVFVPIHRLPPYSGGNGSFPYADRAAACGISLPTYVGLDGHVAIVSAHVLEVVDGIRKAGK